MQAGEGWNRLQQGCAEGRRQAAHGSAVCRAPGSRLQRHGGRHCSAAGCGCSRLWRASVRRPALQAVRSVRTRSAHQKPQVIEVVLLLSAAIDQLPGRGHTPSVMRWWAEAHVPAVAGPTGPMHLPCTMACHPIASSLLPAAQAPHLPTQRKQAASSPTHHLRFGGARLGD